ncbi:succinyldiaminopimelate transaminase [Thiobacter aerophilum]|uniref:Succinyldiaminopimelate transaminase n=1 Tax=Thiobacter aerophilum TaxID=3121275 RepID=A0ABV0EAT4_9BURK
MNPDLAKLKPYPFQRLRALLHGLTPPADCTPINLSIGEPKHPTPAFIRQALVDHLDGLSGYPATHGMDELRLAIAHWLEKRYALPHINPQTQVLPVLGSREALFAFAQVIVDRTRQPVVISPNPFYQIYEGAALLAGAEPYYVNTTAEHGFRMDLSQVPPQVLARTQLVYVCSPGNPTGKVMHLDDWRVLFELSDRHDFVIAADECYSEIYFDEANPPLGALEAAHRLGRRDFVNLVVFGSLSKRSNVPGMRSGFVAGDAELLEKFLLYRTYHGCAMSPTIQHASAVAWRDEAHVAENRRLYRAKFEDFRAIVGDVLSLTMPDAAFYYWVRTPIADTVFAQGLYRDYNVTVLPGTFLAREAHGANPGAGFVRIALVASETECREAAERIRAFVKAL